VTMPPMFRQPEDFAQSERVREGRACGDAALGFQQLPGQKTLAWERDALLMVERRAWIVNNNQEYVRMRPWCLGNKYIAHRGKFESSSVYGTLVTPHSRHKYFGRRNHKDAKWSNVPPYLWACARPVILRDLLSIHLRVGACQSQASWRSIYPYGRLVQCKDL
jgi:hypothetical protein